MSVREENELSNECTGGVQISAAISKIQSPPGDGTDAISPQTGDPNPKKFFAKPGDDTIDHLSVALDDRTATFTADELFGSIPLHGLAFTLECDPPELASIIIPHDGRTWRNQFGTSLKPDDTASSIVLNDPAQQRLDSAFNRVSLSVKLKLQKTGTMRVHFNMDVTNTPGVTKADTPVDLLVKIV